MQPIPSGGEQGYVIKKQFRGGGGGNLSKQKVHKQLRCQSLLRLDVTESNLNSKLSFHSILSAVYYAHFPTEWNQHNHVRTRTLSENVNLINMCGA